MELPKLVSSLVALYLGGGKQQKLMIDGAISEAITFKSFPGILSRPGDLDGSRPRRNFLAPNFNFINITRIGTKAHIWQNRIVTLCKNC